MWHLFYCQDETCVAGNNNEHQKILARKGHREILYKHSNGSRLHVTLCITVCAIGATTGVRVVHDGQVMDGRCRNSFHLNLMWLFPEGPLWTRQEAPVNIAVRPEHGRMEVFGDSLWLLHEADNSAAGYRSWRILHKRRSNTAGDSVRGRILRSQRLVDKHLLSTRHVNDHSRSCTVHGEGLILVLKSILNPFLSVQSIM